MRQSKLTWVLAGLTAIGVASAGWLLGHHEARARVWSEAAVADRLAPNVREPSLPSQPFYPTTRTPTPLPTAPAVTVRGEQPSGFGEFTMSNHVVPIQMVLRRNGWSCEVLDAAGAGSATGYEWECGMPRYSVRVLLAPCLQACDAAERAPLRPAFMPTQLSTFDDTTWVTNDTYFGAYRLAMEHIWAAPAGILRTDAPPQLVYVAALATAPASDATVAEDAINQLRTGM